MPAAAGVANGRLHARRSYEAEHFFRNAAAFRSITDRSRPSPDHEPTTEPCPRHIMWCSLCQVCGRRMSVSLRIPQIATNLQFLGDNNC